MKLSNAKIKSLKPKQNPYKISDGKGLILLVHPNGSKYWRLFYYFNNKQKTLALGVYPYVSLAQARERTFEAKCLIANGVDPSEKRRKEKIEAKGTHSFQNIAFEWFKTNTTKWSDNHAKGIWKSLEDNIFNNVGHMSIESIKPQDILKTLKVIEKRGSLVQLRKIKQRCSKIFNYAIVQGLITQNPTDGLEEVFKTHKATNFNHITAKELPELVESINSLEADPTTKTGLIIALHTFLRTNEIRYLTWDCIDFENRLIVVPKEMMKMKREHLVPMSETVFQSLRELQQYTGRYNYVFASTKKPTMKPFSENAMLYALYRLGWKGRTSVHGFRHLASTTLREHGFKRQVVEKQLSHEIRNSVEASYNKAEYLPDRIEMMNYWSDFIINTNGQIILPESSNQLC